MLFRPLDTQRQDVSLRDQMQLFVQSDYSVSVLQSMKDALCPTVAVGNVAICEMAESKIRSILKRSWEPIAYLICNNHLISFRESPLKTFVDKVTNPAVLEALLVHNYNSRFIPSISLKSLNVESHEKRIGLDSFIYSLCIADIINRFPLPDLNAAIFNYADKFSYEYKLVDGDTLCIDNDGKVEPNMFLYFHRRSEKKILFNG